MASLETDKVAVEVPSPVAGVMGEQVVKQGDTVAVGAVIARVEEGGAGVSRQPPLLRPSRARGRDWSGQSAGRWRKRHAEGR